MSKEYERDDTVDAILLWNVIKMLIRASSIKYAKEYRAKQRRIEISLEKDISTIEQKLEGNDLSDEERGEFLTELTLRKKSLELLISYKTQGSIIRSKTRWYNEGEKKYQIFLRARKKTLQQQDYTKLKNR